MGYPIWEISIGGAVLMAVVAITHVIVAHFAIGGGLVIAVTETLSVRRGDPALRELARRSSLMLILVSTVFGAISGVGIWVVAGLISPAAISALIHSFVWGWAMEWVLFIVEIVAALVYYSTWGKISRAAHLMVAWIYFAAAFGSLVVINGILTFMLTPGEWSTSHAFWDGFFNPTYWPSLLLRTGIAAVMATVFMVFPALRAGVADRGRLLRYLGLWLLAGVALSYAGYRWWEAALPDGVRALFLGAEPTLAALAGTRSFLLWSLTGTMIAGFVLLVAAPRLARAATAAVLMVAAFAFFGGYERLREGVRKPFLISGHMFSNGLLVTDIEAVNRDGFRAHSGWVDLLGAGEPLATGREIFRAQCGSCHTLDGYQAIRSVLPSVADVLAVAADSPSGSGARRFQDRCARCHPDVGFEDMREMLPTAEEIEADPEMIRDLNLGMISATMARLHEMGSVYAGAAPDRAAAAHRTEFPFMPPLVGSDEEIDALAAYLASIADGPPPRQVARAGGE